MTLRTIALALCAMLVAAPVAADGNTFGSRLSGYQEVPALSSAGSGHVALRIGDGIIEYSLTYQNLDSGVLFAHIHVAQAGVNGGVAVFLCSNAPAPVATPACPETGGTVSGLLTAADVIGPAEQGVAPGEFDEFVRAIRAGVTYANVHTNDFNAGELRGQIRPGSRGKGEKPEK